MSSESFLHYENQRKTAYQLLASYYYLPQEDTFKNLKKLLFALEDICSDAAEFAVMMKVEKKKLEQLRVDFSKLFVGPFKLLAPPYGSVHLEKNRKVMGDTTLDVKERFRQVGLDISNETKEAPDHIAIELEYMYYLTFKEIEAIVLSKFKEAMEYLLQQRSFLQEHLGRWVPSFTNDVKVNAETNFYKNMAEVTEKFIHCETMNITNFSICNLVAYSGANQD